MKIPMTRRKFLNTSLVAAAAVALPSLIRGQPSNPEGRKRVIIVGAGLAGLASAYKLSQLGSYDIILLEAQDRPGGRIQTLRTPFVNGQYAEVGPFFISEFHSVTLSYIRNFKLKIQEVLKEGARIDYHFGALGTSLSVGQGAGHPIGLDPKKKAPRDWPDLRADEQLLGLWPIFRRYICSRPERFDVTAAKWPYLELAQDLQQIDKMNFIDFLSQPHLNPSPGVIGLIRPWFGWWDDLQNMSALALMREGTVSRQMCSDAHVKWYTVTNGMDSLPKAFAEQLNNLGVKILYGAPVVAISQNATSVTATYEGKRRSYGYLIEY